MSEPLNRTGTNPGVQHQRTLPARLHRTTENDSTARTGGEEQIDIVQLSVHVRMRARLEGLRQVMENLEQGDIMLSIADSGLNSITNHLLHLRQLALKSANGTYTNRDRQMIQVEVSQIIDEIDRIASQTEFNNMTLLKGNFARTSRTASLWLQMGPDSTGRERIYIGTNTSRALGLSLYNGAILTFSTMQFSRAAIGVTDHALEAVTKQRAELAAYRNRIHDVRDINQNEIKIISNTIKENPPDQNLPELYAPR